LRSLCMLSVLLPRNVPGRQKGGYPRPHNRGAPQGTTHPTHVGTYPQAPVLSGPAPEVPVRYGTSQPLQQHPLGQDSRLEYVRLYSVPSATGNEPHTPQYPLGFAHQRSPGLMTEVWSSSQGSAGVPNAHTPYPLGFERQRNPGPMVAANSPQGYAGAQNAHTPYPLGFERQQNPRPMDAANSPSQGHAGAQNAHTTYPLGFERQQNPRPMAAANSPSQGYAGAQNAHTTYPLGFERQRSPGPMSPTWSPSQGSVGVRNAPGGRHSQVRSQSLVEDNRTARTILASPGRSVTGTAFFHLLHCCIINLSSYHS
jgi:hypothetical protein